MTAVDKVIELRRANSCATLEQIGNRAGVTRQRVSQILLKAGLTTRHYIQDYLCIVCGAAIKTSYGYKRKGLFCSQKCRSEYHTVTVECEICGKQVKRLISRVLSYPGNPNRHNHIFCGRKCWETWAAKNAGFGNKYRKVPKDTGATIRTIYQTGVPLPTIAKDIGISLGYAYKLKGKN
uniref:Putative sigma-70 region domain containing protein n=1 Tax=viral metagenome TaxID=1070528 RepID=A0A6H1ZWY4_9ZZZZ